MHEWTQRASRQRRCAIRRDLASRPQDFQLGKSSGNKFTPPHRQRQKKTFRDLSKTTTHDLPPNTYSCLFNEMTEKQAVMQQIYAKVMEPLFDVNVILTPERLYVFVLHGLQTVLQQALQSQVQPWSHLARVWFQDKEDDFWLNFAFLERNQYLPVVLLRLCHEYLFRPELLFRPALYKKTTR
jgi:hypothetical protein